MTYVTARINKWFYTTLVSPTSRGW